MHYFSTVEIDNVEKSRIIRPYKKSSLPRLRWTPDLHDHFVEVVCSLGGKYKATPKKIMQMMGVKGLKISHIKSHLQMYRSMREIRIANEFTLKNYQEKIPNLRQICETSREAPNDGKLVRVPFPFTCQVRRRVTQKGTNVIYHEYQETYIHHLMEMRCMQMQGAAQGSSTSEITRGSSNNLRANLEIQTTPEINFLGLGNHQTSESSSLNSPLNLELTIS